MGPACFRRGLLDAVGNLFDPFREAPPHPPEALHGPFSLLEWQVAVLSPVVEPAADFWPMTILSCFIAGQLDGSRSAMIALAGPWRLSALYSAAAPPPCRAAW